VKSWRAAAAAVLLLATGFGVLRFVASGSADPEPTRLEPFDREIRDEAPQREESETRPSLEDPVAGQPSAPRITWRRSVAIGSVSAGRLVRGVLLPASGRDWFTWDPILERSPGRSWRRWGTDLLVRKLLKVIREYRRSNPSAPRVTVGDLSRPRGGDFGPRFGLPGHVSHQNGLDADIYYPRLDGAELKVDHPGQIDGRLAQDLVDRFVAAGAELVFVGPATGLRGPPAVVQVLTNHDDHMHVRFPPG
jgi:Penicillin-insensitive murein endopeptidase